MKLLLVESPAKAKKIKEFVGSEFRVQASRGHIRSLPEKELGVDIEHGFTPVYVNMPDKEETIDIIKSLASSADEIFVATDPDREGEAIAQHIVDILKPSDQAKCKRVSYHEITKKAVLKAIANPREIDSHLVDAAKARQVLDRLIGYKVSPVLWYSVAKKTSAGRVQSVALKLVCDKQREIEAFKSVTYWYVDVLLECPEGKFWARVIVANDKDNRFSDKKVAADKLELLKKTVYRMAEINKATKSVQPHPPFDTNSLQGACSAILKWDITKTMKFAQSLYEQGRCTYIRTDSFNISDEALQDVRKYISNYYGDSYLPKKSHNTYAKKSTSGSQEAHECIRPTHVEDCGESLSGDDKKLYDLIRDRFVACQMAPMIVDSVKYIVEAECGDKLLATGQSIAFDGFSKAWRHKNTKEEILPKVNKGDVLDYKDSKQTENKTKPPDRYTDASLANKLEADGVGRPATRAPIIKSLEDKGYLTKDKAALVPTPMGYAIVDFLNPAFLTSFMDIKFTAGMEEEMVKIADGEAEYEPVVSKFYEALMVDVHKIQGDQKPSIKVGVKCPLCHVGDIIEKFNKFGKFITCNNYPECKTIFVKDGDKYVPQKKKEVVMSSKKCSKCGKIMMVRNSSYGQFLGCSGFPACRHTEQIKGNKENS